MLIRQIRGLCSDLETYPPDLEHSSESSAFIGEEGLYICFTSDQKTEVLELMEKGLFVNRVILIADEEEPEGSRQKS